MRSTCLSSSLNFYKHMHSNNNSHEYQYTLRWAAAFPYSAAYQRISALSVSEKVVYRFRFLALCWLGWFSNTCFTLRFALWVASASVLVVVRLKYWWILVLILEEEKNQLLKNNGTCSTAFTHKARNIHYSCFSWNSQLTFIDSAWTCPLNHTYRKPPHKFNYWDLFFVIPSVLAKFSKVKVMENIITLQ